MCALRQRVARVALGYDADIFEVEDVSSGAGAYRPSRLLSTAYTYTKATSATPTTVNEKTSIAFNDVASSAPKVAIRRRA